MDVQPGVYVVSMSVSVEEGTARYNFRVVVKEKAPRCSGVRPCGP